MGSTWGRQDTGVSHVGCRNFAIWVLIRLCVTMFRFVAELTATSTLYIVSVTTLLVCVSRLVAVLVTKLATTTLELVQINSPSRVINMGTVHRESSLFLPFSFRAAFNLFRFTLVPKSPFANLNNSLVSQ